MGREMNNVIGSTVRVVLPDKWSVRQLNVLGTFGNSNTLSRNQLNETKGEYRNIHYGDILIKYNNVINVNAVTLPFVNPQYNNVCKYLLKNGDIVFADTAEDETVGKSIEIVGIEDEKVVAGLHTIVFRPCENYFYPRFLGAFFNSEIFHVNLLPYIQGVKVCSISKGVLNNTFVLIPPIEQQKRIVEILSTWDLAIEKQTLKIQKLELCKKGLMQQLLTGKKRLPGFTEPWQTVRLGDISLRQTRKNENDCTNVVTISASRGFVKQTDFFSKMIASEVTTNYFLVKKDEFCYNKSYCNGYPMGATKRLKEFEEAVVTTLYICFSIVGQINLDFIEQFFESGVINREISKIANEGGRAHGLLNVTPTDFFNVKMFIPRYKEQCSIANILCVADKAITLEKNKLSKLQLEKKGLMQQLLTGKKIMSV